LLDSFRSDVNGLGCVPSLTVEDDGIDGLLLCAIAVDDEQGDYT